MTHAELRAAHHGPGLEPTACPGPVELVESIVDPAAEGDPAGGIVDVDLAALVAAALEAEREIDDHYEDEPPDGAPPAEYRAWESRVDRLVVRERAARNALRGEVLLAAGEPATSAAVVLPSGAIVVACDRADGLAIVPPDRVRRIE